MKRNRLIALLLAIVVVFAFCACSSSGNNTTAAQTEAVTGEVVTEAAAAVEKELIVGTTESHMYFYTCGSSEADKSARRLIYDQLFYVDDVTGETKTDILSSWNWEDDVTLKVVLKDNVMFSDGTQMTGEDILATLKAYVDNQNTEMSFYSVIDYDKSHVEEDGLTTYIIWSQVYGAAMSTLNVPIQSKAFMEAHPDGDDAWWYSPVGSGPYAVDDVQMNSSYTLKLRDDYWNTEKAIEAETITFKFYTDITAEYSDFVTGNINVVTNIPDAQMENYSGLDYCSVVTIPQNNVVMMTFNQNTVPDYLREAITYAVDWDALLGLGYGSLCKKATSHFPSTFACYVDRSSQYSYTYNPEKAAKILSDNNFDSSQQFTFPVVSGSADAEIAEAIQFYLSAVGIQVTVQELEVTALMPALIGGVGDFTYQEAAQGNPDKEPYTLISTLGKNGFGIMAIQDEEFNKLMDAGLATTDAEKRKETYQQMDIWLYEHNQAIPICEVLEAYCYNNTVIDTLQLASCRRNDLSAVTFVK